MRFILKAKSSKVSWVDLNAIAIWNMRLVSEFKCVNATSNHTVFCTGAPKCPEGWSWLMHKCYKLTYNGLERTWAHRLSVAQALCTCTLSPLHVLDQIRVTGVIGCRRMTLTELWFKNDGKYTLWNAAFVCWIQQATRQPSKRTLLTNVSSCMQWRQLASVEWSFFGPHLSISYRVLLGDTVCTIMFGMVFNRRCRTNHLIHMSWVSLCLPLCSAMFCIQLKA